LEELSEKFIKFAQLNDTDVSSSIDSVQSVMAAWGISAKDTGAVLDLLNKAGQDTGTSVDQISDSLVTNGAVLKEMGYSAEDAAFFLANLSKNGIDASSTMAGMKKALANATKEGKPLSDALADVENSIKNAKNSTEAMSVATEIFGAKAAPALTTAIRDGRLSFDELGLSLDDFEGNVEETFENTLDAPDKFKLAIQNLQTEMGKAFNDLFVKYEPQINNALETFTEDILPKIVNGIGWLIDNLPLISAAITGIVTAMIMFQAVSAIQGIIAAWQAYKAATEGATVAQWLLNAAMEANPIGLLIAAITGLIAAFIYLWNNSEDFRNFWIGLWDKIKEAAIPVIEGLSVAFSAAWEAIKAIVHPWIDYFKATWESIKLIFGVVKDVLSGNFSDAWEKIKEIVSVWADYFRGIWENIKSVFTPVKQFFAGLWNGVKTAASEAWNGIKSVFEPVAEWFGNKFKDAWQKVKDVFSAGGKIFDGIKDGIVSAFKTVVNAIIKGINKVITIPFNALNKLLNKVRNVEVAGIMPFDGMWKENPFTVPQIPELEAGGVLKRGQVGLLEGNGAEAVVPLENNKRWINATAKALKGALASEGIVGSGPKVTNNYCFTQNNTSPKALSKLEIYRQTKNQLTLAKGGLA
jgi:phage-related minor tail protein